MEIHQLRYFCAIVKTGSFTRAAEAEHVAQPSLSQQIRKLEDEFGGKLFHRLPRGVRLTPLGELFLPRALAILDGVRAAREDIRNMVCSTRSQALATLLTSPSHPTAGNVEVENESPVFSIPQDG